MCEFKQFANFARNFSSLMKLDSSMAGENSAQSNASAKEQQTTEKPSNVQSAKRNSKDTNRISKANLSSAHLLVLTRVEVLDLLKELSPSDTKQSGMKETVSYVIPYFMLRRKLTGIALDHVLKFLIDI